MTDMFQGPGTPLTADGFRAASTSLEIGEDLASLWAVLSVETRGFGYLRDKRPKILFERHIFAKRTQGRFSAANPDISNRTPGGYSGGAAEYSRLSRAMALNRTAALESASWGLGQVMGFNAESLGYGDVEDMIDKFRTSEDEQLDGCARFIRRNPPLHAAFQAHRWARVAFFYNGPNFAANHYDTKLADAHTTYTATLPAVDIRAGQARLFYAGFDPKGIDGLPGPGTRTAIRAFETSKGLNQTGDFNAETNSALIAAAGV
jgi:hypothetical protein